MHSSIKIIGLGGMGANVLVSMKKNGIIADKLLIDMDVPDFINSQLVVFNPSENFNFHKVGTADLMVIVAGLAGNICSKYLEPLIQYAIRSCKDVVFIGVMPFDFEGRSEEANANYFFLKNSNISRRVFRNQELLENCNFKDLSVKEAFCLINDSIVEMMKNFLV